MSVRVAVSVKPRSKKEGVEVSAAGVVVRVRAPPVEGAANERVLEVVADKLGVRKSAVRIFSGETSRHKVLEIDADDLEDVKARLAR